MDKSWEEERAWLLAEIDRTLAAAREGAEARIRKGAITRQEADRQIGLLEDVRADLVHWFDMGDRPSVLHFPWRAKLEHVDRELDLRRTAWPLHVEKGRITREEASQRIQALERIRALQWECLMGWVPEPGMVQCWDPRRPDYHDPGAARYRQFIRDHLAAVNAKQEELL